MGQSLDYSSPCTSKHTPTLRCEMRTLAQASMDGEGEGGSKGENPKNSSMPDMRLPDMGENVQGKNYIIQKEGTCVRKENLNYKGNGFGGIEEKQGLSLAFEKEGEGENFGGGDSKPCKMNNERGRNDLEWNDLCESVPEKKKKKRVLPKWILEGKKINPPTEKIDSEKAKKIKEKNQQKR